jgi:hypothetical protein
MGTRVRAGVGVWLEARGAAASGTLFCCAKRCGIMMALRFDFFLVEEGWSVRRQM